MGTLASEERAINKKPESDKSNQSPVGKVLSICNFLSKGWEVSILGFLAFIQQKYAMPLYMVGILSTVFIVSQISISFFAGKIAHALKSRNVILLSMTSSAISWLILSLTKDSSWLYLAYTFGGISSGLFEPIGNSLIAKVSSSKNRGAAIGNFAACGDIGRISLVAGSTALVGLFGIPNASGILFGSAVVALLAAVTFIAKTAGGDLGDHEESVHLGGLLKNQKFCFATIAGIADSFSSASLYIFIPFLLAAKGIPLKNTLYFNVIFFAGYLLGRLALGRLADKHGAANVLMECKVGMAVLILLLTLLNSTAMVYLLLFLLGVFTRGSSPIIRAMVADSMHEKNSFHNAFAVYSFASRSSGAVCRPIYGYLASFAGISYVFYAASAVSLLTLYPAAKYKQRQRGEADLALQSATPQTTVS